MKISDSKLRMLIAVLEHDLKTHTPKESDAWFRMTGQIEALKSVLAGEFKVRNKRKKT